MKGKEKRKKRKKGKGENDEEREEREREKGEVVALIVTTWRFATSSTKVRKKLSNRHVNQRSCYCFLSPMLLSNFNLFIARMTTVKR